MKRSRLCATALALLAAYTATCVEVAAQQPTTRRLKEMVVPKDTKVTLKFTQTISTATAKKGDLVALETTEAVVIEGETVVEKGSPATGVITDVRPPSTLGRNAALRISFQSVRAVDGSLIPLSPYQTPEEERVNPRAPAGTVVGAIALGPIGLVAGAFIRGSHVNVQPGATVDAAIAKDTRLPTPQNFTQVAVPEETAVPLQFVDPVTSRTAKEGDLLDFVVSENVYVGGLLVIARGTPATGTVKRVTRPRSLGRNAKIEIAFDSVKGVDGTLLPLSPYRSGKGTKGVNPDSAGVGAAGGVILGPIGIVAGALIKGRHVDIPPGAKVTASLAKNTVVRGQLPQPQ